MRQNWKSLLRADATDWLLEESNPHVRYFALRWLLDKPEDGKEATAASQAIAASAPVRRIIERQRAEGYWGSDSRPYHGTYGPLMLLYWLGAPISDAVKRAMDYNMDGCLMEDGAYALKMKGRTLFLPCHGAEFLQMMLEYGYSRDPRCRRLLNWLVSIQRTDGVWCCISKTKPFPCMWATADVMRAFRDLPPNWKTAKVKKSNDLAVELFLNSDLSRYGKKKADPDWFRFGFPLRYTSDVLEILELVAPFVSPDDERIQDGLALVLGKQDSHGRWPCEKHPRGGMWMEQYVALDKIGEPSKWVTLHALRMLKTLFEEEL